MSYVAAIGHRLSLQDLLDKFSFDDMEEAECTLEEAGVTIFVNNDDVFVTITDKYKIISKKDKYVDLNLNLTQEEMNILTVHTGHTDKRIKLFQLDLGEDIDTNTLLADALENIDDDEDM
jgi:hypothetical protein